MERTSVQRLARVLRALVIITFVCNLLVLPLIPGLAAMEDGHELERRFQDLSRNIKDGYGLHALGHWLLYTLGCLRWVWFNLEAALLAVFFLLCGVCTAVILWQAKKALDTILAGNPFQLSNAMSLHRAAVCCWVISGAALVRFILWLWAEGNPSPFFTYNTLAIPAFFMAGLLFQVMSALFGQAAELKEDQDLTI